MTTRLALLLVLVFLAGCQSDGLSRLVPGLLEPGTLEGHVSIGPLTPAQRAGPPPAVPPQVYAARQVVVYSADGRTILARVDLDAEGNYRVTLAPGSYVINMARVGADRARGLPVTVTIESGKTVTLNIEVDTGIR